MASNDYDLFAERTKTNPEEVSAIRAHHKRIEKNDRRLTMSEVWTDREDKNADKKA